MASNYDAIIVGGGLGGLACAAMLAKRGLKPLVLEKNAQTGGKATSVSARGYKYEMWPIGMAPSRGHSVQLLLKQLGLESELKLAGSTLTTSAYKGASGKWSVSVNDPQKPRGPGAMFDQWGLDAKEREQAGKLLMELGTMTPDKVNALEDTSLAELLSQREVPRAVYSQLAYFANTALAEPVDLVAASECIRTQQDLARNGGGSYPVGGFGRVAEIINQAIKANGGEIRTRARVERIVVEDGKVTGVACKDGEFKAPVVISNCGVQPTVLKLVGEKHFDKSYISYVKELIPGWGFTGQRYFLNKPVLKFNSCSIYSDNSWWDMARFLRVKAGHVPDEVNVFGMVTSNYDPGMAPEGKQILLAGTVCSPNPEAAEIKTIWAKMDETLFKVFPEIVPAIEAKEYAGPAEISSLTRDSVLPGQGGECVGMGQIVGQCGRYKPSPRSPIRGLFYAGCDAGGSLVGTHQATDSGMKVAALVLQYHLMRRSVA